MNPYYHQVSGGRLAWSRTPACHAGNPGSNPGHRIQSTIRIHYNMMRDIYRRESRLAYWIKRVKTDDTLTEADREDILKFIDFMQRGHLYA